MIRKNRLNLAVVIVCSVFIAVFTLLQSYPLKTSYRRLLGLDVREFVSVVSASDHVNTQWFWQWRDATGGSFTFDQTTSRVGMTRRLLKPTSNEWLLHTYRSKTVASSIDKLVYTDADQNAALMHEVNNFSKESRIVLKQGSDFILFRYPEERLLLIFVTPAAELPKVDGLFDFISSERELLKNSFWVNSTMVNIRKS